MLRSRCRYEDLGEKPTSYFLNLEKRNFTNKVITKIIDDDKEYTSTEEILNSQTMYYKTLYSEKINIYFLPLFDRPKINIFFSERSKQLYGRLRECHNKIT